jgi:NAD(P)H-hydrate epimerase
MTSVFSGSELRNLYKPSFKSSKNQNGLVTIIGGSKLFHGAPLFSLITASRFVDMVFFSSPEPSIGEIANQIKSRLNSFIWVPWDETREYVKKSDAILVGPGFMRYSREEDSLLHVPSPDDNAWQETREITRDYLLGFPDKYWVIDAGSLQVLEPEWIPEHSILTPNQKEYKILFDGMSPEVASKKYSCTIVIKGPSTFVYAGETTIEVKGGNPGLTKGGTGDIQAGLTVALLAKNEPVLAASAASYIVKKAADELYEKVGIAYNSDDLAAKIPTLFFPQNMR